jgi:predicted membrane protein
MAKRKKQGTKPIKKTGNPSQSSIKKSPGEVIEKLGEAFIHGFFNLLGKFGLAGILVLILYWFLTANASDEQKKEIIDMWFLYKNLSQIHFVIISILLICIILLTGQWLYYKNRIRILKEEVTRLSAEKTAYQEVAIGKELNHTKKKSKK